MSLDMQTPCSFVIFGATGNLATKKLLPALYHLEQANRLPGEMNFVALGRREWDDEMWRDHVRALLQDKLKEKYDKACAERF